MTAVLNVAAYRFAPLTDLKVLRTELLNYGQKLGLRGTILLSPEGINLFMAASREKVDAMLTRIRSIHGFETLETKESISSHQPFNRFLVKIKQEIISFGQGQIPVADYQAQKLSPKKLKAWLDAGDDVVMLDTRNDYEMRIGTFENAIDPKLKHFRDFPNFVSTLDPALKKKPIVMFCTGGIRCEKAGPYMAQQGFENIYQLEGGVLKYFEDCGGQHWNGECFVFDHRVAVDPELSETQTAMCFACLEPLSEDEQRSDLYLVGKQCPRCYRSQEQKKLQSKAARKQNIRDASTPLPGSTPYTNRRPIRVPESMDGMSVLDFVSTLAPHVDRETWATRIDQGQMVLPTREGDIELKRDDPVAVGKKVFHVVENYQEPDVNAELDVLYEDETLVVFNKPAPLPMHACGRFRRNTFQYIIDTAFSPLRLRAAHRLDANTTGVLVCTKSKRVAKRVQTQFDRNEVTKRYVASVQGHPKDDHFLIEDPISKQKRDAGTRSIGEGKASKTEVWVKKRNIDGTSLVELAPHTGRTNQLRLHLSHIGHPIVGDGAYDPELDIVQTKALGEAPLHLHAWWIEVTHPASQDSIRFSAPLPAWYCP